MPIGPQAPVKPDLDIIRDERDQRADFFAGRAMLENLTNVLVEELTRFNDLKTKGTFNTIPAVLKQAMLRWETAYKDVRTLLLADQEIVDVYQWRP